MQYTTNYNLAKPQASDDIETASRTALNTSMDTIDTQLKTNATSIGTLSSLETTEKSNLVGAINEENDKIDILYNGDYVVAQGTNGDWYYRKWNSGLIELDTRYNQGTMATTTPYGSVYISSALIFTLPNLLVTLTNILGTVDLRGGIGGICLNNSYNASTIGYYIWSATNRSGYNPVIHWHVVGTWK